MGRTSGSEQDSSLLRQILLENRINGKLLFRSMAELSRSIACTTEPDGSRGFYAERVPTLSALLCQIFRGERRCNDLLKGYIIAVVKDRLQQERVDENVSNRWMQQLHNALVDSGKKSSVLMQNGGSLFFNMLREIEQGQEIFIVAPNPLEFIRTDNAALLRELILERLGLYPSIDSSTTPIQYTVCLPNEVMAKGYWIELLQSVLGAGTKIYEDHAVVQRLKMLESKGFLQVMQIPPSMCGSNLVMISQRGAWSGYNIYFHHENQTSIARLNSDTLAMTRSAIYQPIKNGSGGVVRNQLSDFLAQERPRTAATQKENVWDRYFLHDLESTKGFHQLPPWTHVIVTVEKPRECMDSNDSYAMQPFFYEIMKEHLLQGRQVIYINYHLQRLSRFEEALREDPSIASQCDALLKQLSFVQIPEKIWRKTRNSVFFSTSEKRVAAGYCAVVGAELESYALYHPVNLANYEELTIGLILQRIADQRAQGKSLSGAVLRITIPEEEWK